MERSDKMNGVKIIQMLYTERKVNALFRKPTRRNPYQVKAYPVLGLVLVEEPDGLRDIKPMYIGPMGLIEILDRGNQSFIGLRSDSEGLYLHETIAAI